MLSSGKSIFVFNAVALLGVIGLVVLFFRNRPLVALLLLLIVPRLFFFAKFVTWDGGWAWGPRYMFPTVPLFVLAAVELLRATDRRSAVGVIVRTGTAVLVAYSLAINYVSVRVPYEQWLQTLSWGTPASLARVGLHQTTFSQAWTDYTYNWSTGPIWGDLTLLHHHVARMAPEWWAIGRWYVGVVFLLVGVTCLTLAVLYALDTRSTWPLSRGDARNIELVTTNASPRR
jgi:hypothetical protein